MASMEVSICDVNDACGRALAKREIEFAPEDRRRVEKLRDMCQTLGWRSTAKMRLDADDVVAIGRYAKIY